MAPPTWSTPEQLDWLKSHVGAYVDNKISGDQIQFFAGLDEAWFKRWPEEEPAKLPERESGVALTPDQTAILANTLEARRKASRILSFAQCGVGTSRRVAGGWARQIRSWFRNHTRSQRESGVVAAKKADQGSLAAALWNDQKRERNPQVVELYQKIYPERVKEGLEVAGFQAKHSQDLDFVTLDGEKPPEEVKVQLKAQASARLSARRVVSMSLLADETEDVKKELEEELNKIKRMKLEGKMAEKLTPESAQRSLDQLEGIVDRFHQILNEKTGWVGFTLVGGPTPNAGGALSMQVFSSGLTPAGHTFKQVHSDWKGAVSLPFTHFLKRCFTRSERDAMALPEPNALDDLLQMPDEDQEEAPSPSPKFVAPKRKSTSKKQTKKQPNAVPPTAAGQSQMNGSLAPAPPSQTAAMNVPPALPAAQENDSSNLAASDASSWNGQSFDWDAASAAVINHSTALDLDFDDADMDSRPDLGFDDVELEPTGLPQDFTAEELQKMVDAETFGAPWLTEGSVLKSRWWENSTDARGNGDVTNATNAYGFSGAGTELKGMSTIDGNASTEPAQGSQSQWTLSSTPIAFPPPASSATPAAHLPPAPAAPRRPVPPAPRPVLSPTPAAAPAPAPLAPSTARSHVSMANTSPLPPRMLRKESSTAAIVSSTAALAAAMANTRSEDVENSDDDDDDDDMPLARREPSTGHADADAAGGGEDPEADEIPLSRPMANVPKPAGPRGRGGAGGAGGGGGRSGGAARGAARGAVRGRGRGGGGTRGRGGGAARGGARGGGTQSSAADHGEGGSGGGRERAADGGMEGREGGSDSGEADRGEGGSQGERPAPRPLYLFRQTYGDNGEVIPLPLDAATGRLPHGRMKEIRAFEREQDKKEKTKATKPPQPGVWCLPRPPGAPMPPIPELGPPGRFNQERENAKQEAALALGRPGRQKRAPKNPNEEADLLEARMRDAKGKKRKVDENEDVSADLPRKRGKRV
ncbi:hypothetical protein B0H16DRAFT_1736135 [Mycena metata]|uniref:Uncharacterized protein n=1 Tax=Mycena metata TaxID=1033252 RepID=A0AAD7HPX0_9AGAR|nr:hypothetical protein B0H16DRAFT_1736135 [Mycena metata]